MPRSKEGREFKFQGKQWVEKLQDPEFRQVIFDVMDEHVIYKPPCFLEIC